LVLATQLWLPASNFFGTVHRRDQKEKCSAPDYGAQSALCARKTSDDRQIKSDIAAGCFLFVARLSNFYSA